MVETNKIILGDCIGEMKKLPDNSIDAIITDPPYNTGMKKANSKARLSNFFDDSYTDEEYDFLIDSCCKEFYRLLKEDKAGYIYINWKKMQIWIDKLEKYGFNVKNVIVWNKMVHGLNYQNYAYQYELIIYFVKGKFILNNKGINDRRKRFFTDVWNIKRDMGKQDNIETHETVKQINVVRIPIQHCTHEGDLVLDCFAGSGTTGVACKQLKRNYILIEKEKEYIDIIKGRLSQQTLK